MNSKNIGVKEIKQQRNNCLLLLGLLGAIAGCLNAFLYDLDRLSNAVGIASTFGAVVLILLWIIYDAKIQNFRLPLYLKIVIILLPFIGLPIYFWQTRSFANFCLNIGGFWLAAFYRIIYLIAAYAIANLFL